MSRRRQQGLLDRRRFLLSAATAPGLLRAEAPTNIVFVRLAGGISQQDTFDFKRGPWTPPFFRPGSFGGVQFPTGLMPRIADVLECVSFLRGICAPSLAHSEAQAALPCFPSLGVCGEESLYGAVCAPACGFEEACASVRERVRGSRGGCRIEITLGGWDSHADIYGGSLNSLDPEAPVRRLDAGVGRLIAGLREDGLLAQTLIVAMGEFGRQPGALNSLGGRSHFTSHAALLAGWGAGNARVIQANTAGGVAEYFQRQFGAKFRLAPNAAMAAAATT